MYMYIYIYICTYLVYTIQMSICVYIRGRLGSTCLQHPNTDFFGSKLPFRGMPLWCIILYPCLFQYEYEPLWSLVSHSFREPSNWKNLAFFWEFTLASQCHHIRKHADVVRTQ